MRCGPDDLPDSVRNYLFKGTYELGERLLVKEIVKPGSRVLEIGTGIGFISLLCTRIAGEGNVLSFEANPALRRVIEENYALNGVRPRLEMKAVTTDGKPIRFFQNDNIISSSLMARDIEAKEIEVESASIHDVIESHRPDVIVMDVEGAEIDLLATAHLSGVSGILVELHPHIVGAEKIEALKEHILGQGFRLDGSRHKNALFVRDNAGRA
ncbi:FkbM family methyltransferase [Maritimibacter sp. 55A14]|uniref:FkbM family methyltransferase n=1 Tax=Maritimibacter sp. 55A14 TaxID=2174844 RepID=UPI00130497F6|nr:FkbM family methyltransferase [Maritimibacter sp. 55A14]